jgi:hypothetical protein
VQSGRKWPTFQKSYCIHYQGVIIALTSQINIAIYSLYLGKQKHDPTAIALAAFIRMGTSETY